MSKIAIDRSVVEQALKAMTDTAYGGPCFSQDVRDSLKKLRAALEQPQVEQEPVGEAGSMPGTDGFTMVCFRASDVPAGTKLYTHPQPPRQPLTDEQKAAITRELNQARCLEKRVVGNIELTERIARAVEAAHGIGGEK